MPSTTLKPRQVYQFDTTYSADSVEFCPTENFQEFFCVGTYQVVEEESASASAPYSRKGKLVLMKEIIDKDEEKVAAGSAKKLVAVEQEMEGRAILDMKWNGAGDANSDPILASVTSTGHTLIYSLKSGGHDSANVKLNEIACHSNSTESLVLSLDWALDSKHIASSQSNGFLQIINVENGCETIEEWKAHDFEAWITCYDPSSPSILYSGGDDCKFKSWDQRVGFLTPTMVNKHTHSAGVTTISRDPFQEFSIATGSYDENVRLWDTRMLKSSVSSIETGGGVWRIKFHPTDSSLIAVASMYNGFHILNRNTTEAEDGSISKQQPTISIASELKEPHASIGYGIDWSRKTGRLGACSFYDHLFSLWDMEPVFIEYMYEPTETSSIASVHSSKSQHYMPQSFSTLLNSFGKNSSKNKTASVRGRNTPPPASYAYESAGTAVVSIFGMPLSQVLAQSNKVLKRCDRVPKIALECMDFIEADGMNEVGIYRLSGSTKDINIFRSSYDAFMSVDFRVQQYTDPNAVASLFKAYVRELPECLLGDSLVNEFLDLFAPFSDNDSYFKDTITLEDDEGHIMLHNEELLVNLETLIKKLPEENRDFLAVFLAHLRRISLNASVNKMGLNNLQVVWSPTLRFGGGLFMMLILQHKRLFPINTSPLSIDLPLATPPKSAASSIHTLEDSSESGQSKMLKRTERLDFDKKSPSAIVIPARASSSTPSPTFRRHQLQLDPISTTSTPSSRTNEIFLPEVASISTSPIMDFSSFSLRD